MSDEAPLLRVEDLTVSFASAGARVLAVDHVSFEVRRGASVALVGESGCGKSVTAHSILRLVPAPPGRTDAGAIWFEGRDLVRLPERELNRVRGGRIGMVFQEPMTSLNPVYSIAFHVIEAIRLHQKVSRREARKLAIEGLRRVGFPDPEKRIDAYPHELSGGMRQRVLIAMALACSPALLIADEPTTALDATIQAQILELIQRRQEEDGMALLLVSHDLGVVAEVCQETVVLYAGVIMERGPTRSLLEAPAHPYTRALLDSIPPTGFIAYRSRNTKGRRLPTIEGSLPDLRSPPRGCRFQARCPEVMPRCRQESPELYEVPDQPSVARCFLVEERRSVA